MVEYFDYLPKGAFPQLVDYFVPVSKVVVHHYLVVPLLVVVAIVSGVLSFFLGR